ncbi:MAG: hypothetical protein GWP11_03520 [Proteobacteria bacterium]|nr:hypothetical protein [Pseudomonadota bacterium]
MQHPRRNRPTVVIAIFFLLLGGGFITGLPGGPALSAALASPAPGKRLKPETNRPAPVAVETLDPRQLYVRPVPPILWRGGLSLSSFVTRNFVGSGRCANCHTLLTDRDGNDMSISNHWRSTMMANAARDPFWQAKVSSEVARNPALRKVIEGKCVICHMPAAWTQAHADGEQSGLFGPGFLNGNNPLHDAAMDGVTCSFCHQIQDKGLGTEASFSGKFKVDTAAVSPGRAIFGPYRDPVTRTMRAADGFTPAYGPQTNDSALCATCHTLYTPYLDGKGRVAGTFPEQTPYLEWRHSSFGRDSAKRHDIGEADQHGVLCQECHMPHSREGGVIISRWAPPGIKARDHFSRHLFVGGNVLMLEVLEDNNVLLGLTTSNAKLEDTRLRTLHQLQTGSARLSLVDSRRSGNTLSATVKVENLVGHKFPSGFPTRRLWLHFRVTDNSGGVVFESGRPLANGAIAGNDNYADPATFEPHYDRITRAGQVQIYETIMADTDGRVTYTLLRAAGFVKDNRLLPAGFDKTTAPEDIAVQGRARQDDNFRGGSDQVTYEVDLGHRPGPFTVTAELLYDSISPAFAADLNRDAGLPPVRRFSKMLNLANRLPVAVAAIRWTVPIDGRRVTSIL